VSSSLITCRRRSAAHRGDDPSNTDAGHGNPQTQAQAKPIQPEKAAGLLRWFCSLRHDQLSRLVSYMVSGAETPNSFRPFRITICVANADQSRRIAAA